MNQHPINPHRTSQHKDQACLPSETSVSVTQSTIHASKRPVQLTTWQVQIAWATGFADGEGFINIQRVARR